MTFALLPAWLRRLPLKEKLILFGAGTSLIATGLLLVVLRNSDSTRERAARIVESAYYASRVIPVLAHLSSLGHQTVERPHHSWRLYAFVRMNQSSILADFERAWDDPANEFFASLSPVAFCVEESPETRVFAVTGPGTALTDASRLATELLDLDTILVIEVRDSQTHWMEPGDFVITQLHGKTPQEAGFGAPEGTQEGFFVGFADRKAWLLSYDIPMSILLPFMTIDGARAQDRDVELASYRIKFGG